MCLAPYLSSYPSSCRSAYAYLCRALYRRLRLCLNLNLNLDLNLAPYPALNRASFQKPLGKPNPALFRWLYGLKYRSLLVRVNLAPDRET
jgi:hypothetical protein